jgi:hypothetical protein
MSAITRRLTSGTLRDGLAINARELANSANMSGNATRQALRELEAKGFIVNLTPELPIDKAVVRLTCFPYQGRPATEDYTRIPLTSDEQRRLDWLDSQESKFKALRRRATGGRR